MNYLYILEVKPLSVISFVSILSWSAGCCLVLLWARNVFPMFSSRSFMVSCLIFKSLAILSYFSVWLGFPDSSVGKESACNAGDRHWIPWSGRSPGEGIGYPFQYSWVSLVAQLVKNLPAYPHPPMNFNAS